ncbi:hypothetical protein BU26DRAFT_573872 [Trematosphaeria pertusa]|uniref:Uncharacterized protein n=1 Tax=Trematosphaeria pertusa TaxID=390896 RepID=A0A6A6J066_9PLEO|nr:uncharacterized protein BU26DRAFT_573872 [Trematosphaeria pertusa]KAF2256016.1 hypothetical protein BU26DRAFT_573872 [Trematosphaeria pertusa]
MWRRVLRIDCGGHHRDMRTVGKRSWDLMLQTSHAEVRTIQDMEGGLAPSPLCIVSSAITHTTSLGNFVKSISRNIFRHGAFYYPIKGRTVVAKADIPTGTRFFPETPLLALSNSQTSLRELIEDVNGLSYEHNYLFLQLSRHASASIKEQAFNEFQCKT